MPIVTLTTDFGLRDPFVAEVKAVILGACPGVTIVDITHDVEPHDVMEAALALSRASRWFPEDTVHMAVVDPGVGTERAAVACRARQHLFVGPDNGVLSLAVGRAEACHEIRFNAARVSPTFHGRDVFARAAAALASGRALQQLGPPHRLSRLALPKDPRVLGADRYGNLYLSVKTVDLPDGAHGVVVEGLDPAPIGRTYGDVPSGSLIAYGGSAGLVEVAVRDGSAAARLQPPLRGLRVRFM